MQDRSDARHVQLIRSVAQHLGYNRAIDDNLLPLIKALLDRDIQDFDSICDKTANILSLLRTEHHFASTLLGQMSYLDRSIQERTALQFLVGLMFRSIENKANFFREIISKLQDLCISLKRDELAASLQRFEPNLQFRN